MQNIFTTDRWRALGAIGRASTIVLLVACGGGGGGGDGGGSGDGGSNPQVVDSLRFNYTIGTRIDVFSAKGEFRFTPNHVPVRATMAAAWFNPGQPTLYRVVGQQVEGSGFKAVSANFYSVPVGEPLHLSDPDPGPEPKCYNRYCHTGIFFLLGDIPANSSNDSIVYGHACRLTAGSIRINEAGRDRMKGVFSGIGVCWNYTNDSEEPLKISDGTFDLPMEYPERFGYPIAPRGLLPEGSVSCDFWGRGRNYEYTGRVNAQGATRWKSIYPREPWEGRWAYGLPVPVINGTDEDYYRIRAAQPGTNSSATVELEIHDRFSRSSFTIPCGAYCASVGIGVTDSLHNDGFYGTFTSGSLQINRMSKILMRGTFSGECHSVLVGGDCRVTNGSFDVPLMEAYEPPF